MPDIQSAMRQALTKTLQQWDDDEGTSVPVPSKQPVSISVSAPSQTNQGASVGKLLFPIKNNITRVTFNYVRDNPGSTRKEIITALDHQGFGQGSTSSLLSQLAKNNLIHATNGLFYADVQEYTPVKKVKPMKSNGLKPAREIIKPKDVKKESAGIAALHPDTAELPHPKRFVSLVRNRAPQDVLKDMTVYQAHELYVHLKQMFGG